MSKQNIDQAIKPIQIIISHALILRGVVEEVHFGKQPRNTEVPAKHKLQAIYQKRMAQFQI